MAAIEQAWQSRGAIACMLWPVSMLYRLIISLRRLAYRHGLKKVQPVTLPVVVVGNLSVGGTGKTPLCAWLVNQFEQAGWKPGIVSRGYGGERHNTPHMITAVDTATSVGDEPLMLFEQTGVPVCVCVKRALAVEQMTADADVDIIFADDGLQHLAMARMAEVVVIDGRRGFGNRWMLPAGPLREPLSRLSKADLVAVQTAELPHASIGSLIGVHQDPQLNGFSLMISSAIALVDGHSRALEEFKNQPVVAMAGIGHPVRFFDALCAKGLLVHAEARPDHHVFTLADFSAHATLPVLVTSKDAVKLKQLSNLPANVYEVPVVTTVNETLQRQVGELENYLRNQPSTKLP